MNEDVAMQVDSYCTYKGSREWGRKQMKWGKPCEQEDRQTDSRAVSVEGREARNVAGGNKVQKSLKR
jgi:hypothetical protein